MMKKLNLIVIGVLAVAVLAGGFYLWSQKKTNLNQINKQKVVVDDGQKQNQQNQQEQNQQQIKNDNQGKNNQEQKENNPNTTEEKIDTSNWKTYRNEELGFEVKYPEKWYKIINTKDQNNKKELQEVIFLGDKDNVPGKLRGAGLVDNITIKYSSDINRLFAFNDDNKTGISTLEELIQSNPDKTGIHKIKKVSVDGAKNAYVVLISGAMCGHDIIVESKQGFFIIFFGQSECVNNEEFNNNTVQLNNVLGDLDYAVFKSIRFIK